LITFKNKKLTKMHRSHNKKNRRNKKKNPNRRRKNNNRGTVIMRNPQQADRVVVTLRWPVASVLTSSGNSVVARRWTPNALYDIDPTFGSTSLPGYSEWVAFYNWNLVPSYSYNITLVNNEAFPVVIYIVNGTVDPGTTGTNFYEYSTAKYGKQKILSAKGGNDRCTIKGRVSVSKLVGLNIFQDNSFRGSSTSNPTTLVYFGIGYNSLANDFTSAGVSFQLELNVRASFFSRKLITT
jgi:hypothetical protein